MDTTKLVYIRPILYARFNNKKPSTVNSWCQRNKIPSKEYKNYRHIPAYVDFYNIYNASRENGDLLLYLPISVYAQYGNFTYDKVKHDFNKGKLNDMYIRCDGAKLALAKVNFEKAFDDFNHNQTGKSTANKCIIYARVNHMQSYDKMCEQVKVCKEYAEDYNIEIYDVVEEYGDSININREKIQYLVDTHTEWHYLIVSSPNVISFGGGNTINSMFEKMGNKVIEVDDKYEISEDEINLEIMNFTSNCF
jgi:predicted site-specific integrase-resolvase